MHTQWCVCVCVYSDYWIMHIEAIKDNGEDEGQRGAMASSASCLRLTVIFGRFPSCYEQQDFSGASVRSPVEQQVEALASTKLLASLLEKPVASCALVLVLPF